MDNALSLEFMTEEQNRRISETVEREQGRLRNFIRKRVLDENDVEDILQEVFYELVQAYRLMQPLEQVGAWLYRVARNRIIDRFRGRRQAAVPANSSGVADEADWFPWEELPSPDGGPEAAYARELLLEEIDAALDELPAEQRQVFVAHEFEGRSFRELARATGLSVNTLLSRKHYAVLYLRRRLRAIYDEFKRS